MKTIEQLTIRQSRRYANDKIRNLPSELQQQVLTFAEFLQFKQQQLEDEGLLKAMQETKDDEIIDLANDKLYLDCLPETLCDR
jgi:Protein of unknown function (DUF2281)